MLDNNEMNEHINDILSREFKGDFASLTHDEVRQKIYNMFYQMFLIDVESMKIIVNDDFAGSHVSLAITGTLLRDADNLKDADITETYMEIEDIEEDEE